MPRLHDERRFQLRFPLLRLAALEAREAGRRRRRGAVDDAIPRVDEEGRHVFTTGANRVSLFYAAPGRAMMASAWILPFLAGMVSAVFAARVWGQFAKRRRPHQFAWGLGLLAYSAASFIEAYVSANPWPVPLYLAYFPLAGATVGLLGLGTVFLARLDK